LRIRSSSSCFSRIESRNMISSSSRARNWFADRNNYRIVCLGKTKGPT
jgi:hypothetical protein